METLTLIQILAIIVPAAVGYPVAKFYWHKYQTYYDLEISWYNREGLIKCFLKIKKQTNKSVELNTITAEVKSNIEKIRCDIANSIEIKKINSEVSLPSHFVKELQVYEMILKNKPYHCSFFVKTPDSKNSSLKLFINLNMSTRDLTIKDKRKIIIRSIEKQSGTDHD